MEEKSYESCWKFDEKIGYQQIFKAILPQRKKTILHWTEKLKSIFQERLSSNDI